MGAPKGHGAAFLALVSDAKSRIREIDIAEYQRLAASKQPHVLIDTREDSEWTAGHAPGAVCRYKFDRIFHGEPASTSPENAPGFGGTR